ncbi:CsgG/HfaB family protein [Fontimonas sp. SYSU GA230001]|uniref:CsgG/HfaB family protein n=1 Tax=Fontimonas sp. SYSU GA230001 TaxID=3142450 RepID=UPI0032B50289
MLRKSLLLFAATLLGACAAQPTATVVSSSGPGIRSAQQEPVDGPKPRIAVSAFEFRGERKVGEGMADMLTAALFNSNRFIVLERARIEDVKAEQDLAATGRFDVSTTAPTGQLEGAELLIRGTVVQFEPDCAGGSVLLASTRQACMAINLRIIDVRTGRVVNATTVEGTSRNTGVGFTYALSDLPIGLGAYRNTPMEQAIRNCIETAVQHIAATKM